jgi:hypothetical protein
MAQKTKSPLGASVRWASPDAHHLLCCPDAKDFVLPYIKNRKVSFLSSCVWQRLSTRGALPVITTIFWLEDTGPRTLYGSLPHRAWNIYAVPTKLLPIRLPSNNGVPFVPPTARMPCRGVRLNPTFCSTTTRTPSSGARSDSLRLLSQAFQILP